MVTNMAYHGPRPVVLHLLIQIHLVVGVCSLRPWSAGAYTSSHPVAAPSLFPCLPDQASALLRLKRSFAKTSESTTAFRSWRAGTDCCGWVGVRCGDAEGRVASLDLGNCRLESGGLDPALFDLTSLENLNLAYNDFNGSQLPSSGFERLTKLTHLNLSTSSFSGPVPTSIGTLTNLVSLDLSTEFEFVDLLSEGSWVQGDSNLDFQLTVQNIETLIANLINLMELHLGFVDLSSNETHWCNTLAKSCPKLQVLRLPYCSLSGPICSSLRSLHSLSVIDLQHNHLSGPIPDFLTNFSNLSVLQLNHNKFQGWISSAIFEHKKLVTIDLYHNKEISGYLPNFSSSSNLVNLNVGRTNLSGIIPASIGNLVSLSKLGLGASGLFGQIPSSIANLKSLSALEISGMGIVGSIPSWVSNLTSLMTLKFYDCGLSGSLPSFIGDLRLLRNLAVCNCDFSGQIPSYISNLTQMQIILLYSNSFFGTIELTSFRKLPYLKILDLSYNNLVVIDGEDDSSLAPFPKLVQLSLSGCNLSEFPNFLRHQDEISWIDLSDNQIHGVIPQWAWDIWNDLFLLDLANNKFTSIGYSPFLPLNIETLDLRNNMFEGTIPIPQGSASMLDYSNNQFSSVPSNFRSHLSDVTLFKASGNNLSGEIPSSFCAGTSIQLLDLSYNNFNGPIPSCLMENVNGMQSLYLNENQLHGEFPNNIREDCSFKALDFSGNWIEGQLPRSLVACKNLEIFAVGNNQISDSFPCWMSTLHRLEVLVLKSNKLFGLVAQSLGEEKSSCTFPRAKIIDLSSNNFYGELPQDQWFKKLKSMIFRDPNTPLIMDHELPDLMNTYTYTAAITYKGHDTTFEKILTTLVFIDFSNNAFNGSIPAAIGELGLLHGLNISHNFLTGPIPSQLGHLNQLEALDLSFNELYGAIPQELASLDFLTTLNLSNNRLVGSIPTSPHFLTFPNSSFMGNIGLCGPPLSKVCINTTTSAVSRHPDNKSVDIMLFLFSGLGFGVGFAIAIVVMWGIPIRK